MEWHETVSLTLEKNQVLLLMPNPDPRRPTFHGKKGRSGRKSLKDELAAHRIAQEIFFKKWDLEEVGKIVAKLKLQKGRLSVREIMIVKALGGNDKMIIAVWDKIAPSKVQHSGAIPVKSILNDADSDVTSDGTGTEDGQPSDHREQGSSTDTVPTEHGTTDIPPTTNA